MLFCSEPFLVFFALVFTAYWALRSNRLRVGLLVAASFVFYASWNRGLAALIGASSVVDFALGLALDAARPAWKRRLLLGLSLAMNLGLLFYFKYVNFFLGSLEQSLRALGADARLPVLKVILPVGISFYTFEAINYTVDVYRRRVPAERNLAHFLLFILFFPHLVAGPIVRARDFLPQVARVKSWHWPRMQLGVQLFLLGLFKKLAIADRMAAYADPVFAQPAEYGSYAIWVAALAYALQIYCDFSGYTDMAIGCAHLLGYKLAANFRAPYLARNVAEFWHRWHISLSSWLRDYVFIPLGGSRAGPWRTRANLLATMVLGGLWHGASWTFVFWGLLHGVLLVVHRTFRASWHAWPRLCAALETRAGGMASTALTFACVCVGWVFFRATSLDSALELVGAMALPRPGLLPPMPVLGLGIAAGAVAAEHALAARPRGRFRSEKLPAPLVGFGYAALLMLALLLAPAAGKPFVYFQF